MAVYTAIDDPSLFFNILTSTGDGGSQDFTGLGFQPDLVWSRRRQTHVHQIYDSVRTAGSGKALQSDATAAEGGDGGTYGYLDSFDSDGFGSTVGSSNNAYFNVSGGTYVFWCWKESATAGFDIVAYTGDGSNRTIAHSLSATPDLVIIKRRSDVGNWLVGGASTLGGNNKLLLMDTTAALDDNSEVYQSFSSSTFGIGVNAYVNTDTSTHIAYLFAGKQGFSKFSSFEGNSNADGPFIYTGFRPAYVMTKSIDTTSNWNIFDNKRSTFNDVDDYIKANANAAEDTGSSDIQMDFVSNGFKIRGNNDEVNASGENYVYAAFAEAPFVNSEGVPCNAR